MGYFAEKEGNIVFTGKYMELYIPQFYFDKDIATVIGDHFSYFGVANFRVFDDIDGKKPQNKLETLKLPTIIISYPTGGFDTQNLDLVGKGEKESYHVLKFYTDDIICAKTLPATAQAFRAFLEALMAGKLPGTLAYSSIIDIWNKNFEMNNVNFDISETIKEIVITELYRWKKDITVKFSKVIGKDPKTSEYDYITISPREVTRLTSTYAGLTFEAFDDMLVSGINNLKYGRKELDSPMNDVIKS